MLATDHALLQCATAARTKASVRNSLRTTAKREPAPAKKASTKSRKQRAQLIHVNSAPLKRYDGSAAKKDLWAASAKKNHKNIEAEFQFLCKLSIVKKPQGAVEIANFTRYMRLLPISTLNTLDTVPDMEILTFDHTFAFTGLTGNVVGKIGACIKRLHILLKTGNDDIDNEVVDATDIFGSK